MSSEGKKFNQAAQVWNHTLYWHSMAPGWRRRAQRRRRRRRQRGVRRYDKFREEFKTSATGQFGSGWAWLTLDGGKLGDLSPPATPTCR